MRKSLWIAVALIGLVSLVELFAHVQIKVLGFAIGDTAYEVFVTSSSLRFDRAWPWDPASRETIFSIELWQLWVALVIVTLVVWIRKHRRRTKNLGRNERKDPEL